MPFSGALSFAAFPLIEFTRNGRLVNEDMKGGETAVLQLLVNRIDGGAFTASRPSEWQAQDLEGFVEPPAGDPFAGFTRRGDVFIVKKNPKALWLPISMADAVQPVVSELRTEFERRRDVYAKDVAEFAEWQTPAGRAARRAVWQKAAASLPNGGEFLSNMEKSDKEIEQANRQRFAPGGPEERGVKEAARSFAEAEALLAELSPELRSAPACYDAGAKALGRRFRPESASGSCRALVKPNWGYFDPKLPRSVPQVIMISGFARCLTRESLADTSRGGCSTNRALLESMDWEAVRAWLDK